MTEEHNALERRARELFRQSCRQLPQADRQALRASRLDALTRQRAPLLQRLLIPAGAVAASTLALVVAWTWLPSHDRQSHSHPAASAAHADNADLEMYQDLDFYRWLAAQDEKAPQRN